MCPVNQTRFSDSVLTICTKGTKYPKRAEGTESAQMTYFLFLQLSTWTICSTQLFLAADAAAAGFGKSGLKLRAHTVSVAIMHARNRSVLGSWK